MFLIALLTTLYTRENITQKYPHYCITLKNIYTQTLKYIQTIYNQCTFCYQCSMFCPTNKNTLKLIFLIFCLSEENKWQTVTRTNNGPLQDFTVSYQSLLPSTSYNFRVIPYNRFGVSFPAYSDEAILTPSKLYHEYDFLQHKPFYRQTWFMVALAATSIIIVIMVIAVLCVKSKSYKYKRK